MAEPTGAGSIPFEPSAVQTRAELANAMRALRRRSGLSIEKMAAVSQRLPPASGRLARSTIGDAETAKTMPSWEMLESFLKVCGVPPEEFAGWRGAWERAKTADLPRPSRATRVRDADPRRLGVHAAIVVGADDRDLPRYVSRDIDTALRNSLTAAADSGGFVLLMGGSSVGKTRTAFEAVRTALPDWWLFHPANGHDVTNLLASTPARTVVWLDELQRYLDGPDRLTAATATTLLQAGLIVMATIWPQEYEARTASADPASLSLADNIALLRLAQVIVVPSTFSEAELVDARAAAYGDARLDLALRAGEPGVTQILAAGPDLVRRWEHATNPYAAAVITAAVDARRLGVQASLTTDYLAKAAPGYLTRQQQAEAEQDWLATALRYATEKVRGAASALIADSGGVMGQLGGYVAADYLVQRGFETRRAATLPESAWQALVQTVHEPEDLRLLAYSADTRWRYTYATQFFGKLAANGDEAAARRLADILAAREPRRAIEVLQPFAQNSHISGKLADLMTRTGDVTGLRRAAESGDLVAACRLVDITAAADLAPVRAAAAHGDLLAIGWLVDHDPGPQHLLELRQRSAAGDRLARARLAEILASTDRLDRAVELLAGAADSGDFLAADHLADMLRRHGQTEQLVTRADGDDLAAAAALEDDAVRGGHVAVRIASALADAGEHRIAIKVLQAHSDALVELTDEYLIDLLVACDRIDLLQALAATGEWSSNRRLAEIAADRGDLDELRALEEGGNWFAAERLTALIDENGRFEDSIAHLTSRAAAADALAAARLPDLLSQAGREEELEALAQDDPWYASGSWARHLASSGRLDEAIKWLRDQHGPGADLAASELAKLLAENGRLEEALAVVRPYTIGRGDGPSVFQLVQLLQRHRRIEDLRVEVNAGASGAMDALLQLLLQNRVLDAATVDRIRGEGVTAVWPKDGTSP